MIKKAINHFMEFHKGSVNILLHTVGFAGLFYSVYNLNWLLFAGFLIVVEIGHVYNHIAGIKKYDFRLTVTIWRLLIFIAVVALFYFTSKLFQIE